MTVGKYAGTPIDQIPNSYLRWMVTQSFPRVFVEQALKKLSESDYSDIYLSISRHGIDMYSKRFIHNWNAHIRAKGEDGDGLATFITKEAQEAWEMGADVSKHRHQDDGIIKDWKGVKWVFRVNKQFPDYKDVVTVMGSGKE